MPCTLFLFILLLDPNKINRLDRKKCNSLLEHLPRKLQYFMQQKTGKCKMIRYLLALRTTEKNLRDFNTYIKKRWLVC